MDYYEYVVVGSGPAGVSAALKLEGRSTCILDVGEEAKSVFPFTSLRDGLAAGGQRDLLGDNWEMLANLAHPNNCHPKLRAQAIQHVMQGASYKVFDAAGELIVNGQGSYAAGGMANAWGAQLFRYTDADLMQTGDWPISTSDLTQYYSELENHIGISGAHDDMANYLGPTNHLQPPVPIVPAAEYLLKKYEAKKSASRIKGLALGRARLAVLTQKHDDRKACGFGETDFFSTEQDGFYTPLITLSALRKRGIISYLGGHKLISFKEKAEHVQLEVELMATKERKKLYAKHLLIGCGTIQTTRLILQNRNQRGMALPFLDHPPSLLPIFFPAAFGSSLPNKSYPIQLIATQSGMGVEDMISFYYPGGMLWSDILPDIPLPMNKALSALRVFLGGMLVAQIWEPAKPNPGNRICLEEDGSMRIDYSDRDICHSPKMLVSVIRSLGGFTLPRMASVPTPTWGFHHASTLPMRHHPASYETYIDGRLWDSQRVRIIDGSVLPSLPAKNSSFTIMANAARIAESVKKCGY